MDPDVMLITGLGLAVLSLPSIISAWAEARAPRVGAIVLIAGLALCVYAFTQKDGGYRPSDVPTILYSFIGEMLS